MASCVGNIRTKNYQNLIIDFQVTAENVGDAFLGHSAYNYFKTEKWETDEKLTEHRNQIATHTLNLRGINHKWNLRYCLHKMPKFLQLQQKKTLQPHIRYQDQENVTLTGKTLPQGLVLPVGITHKRMHKKPMW